MDRRAITAAAALLALGACGGGGDSGNAGYNTSFTANNSAEVLRDAAEQSTPAAREVLLNQAQQIESQNVQVPPGAPGSPVQDAMEKAGNAQVQAPQSTPPRQAVPHKPGDPVPPPTTTPQR